MDDMFERIFVGHVAGSPGEPGKSPCIGENGNWFTWDGEAWVDTGIKPQGEDGAPGKDGLDGKDGERGEKGDPGYTPYINTSTGTWWIGNSDTGIKARGDQGLPGSVWGGVGGDIANQADLMAALNGKVDKGLPWCSGYFQDRSLNIDAVLTPIHEDGDSLLINGNTFVCPTPGIYSISVFSGATNISSRLFSFILLNAYNNASNQAVLSKGLTVNDTHFQSLSWIGHLNAGDFLCAYFSAQATVGTIATGGLFPKFDFVQLSEG